MAAAVPADDVQETLAWEAEHRPRAGGAALAAGILLFGTFLYAIAGFDNSPSVTLTDGFRDALGRPLAGGQKGLLTESAMWFDENGAELLVVTALAAIGTVFIAFALGFLFRATQARRPETSRFILYAALLGPILYGVGPLISAASAVVNAGSYVSDGVFSTRGAHDALRTGTGISVAQVCVGIGQLATALAVVLVSLNAMRVGLLTRFLGILGCIVGALLILPALFGPPAIVQSFWLVALGLLILGRGRTQPPAWETGRAEPWPSRQELGERRERERAGLPDADAADEPGEPSGSVALEDAEALTPGPGAGARRKRKRR